jgi:hypothetical protein
MKLLGFFLLFLAANLQTFADAPGSDSSPKLPEPNTRRPYEYIFVCGAPSLYRWEKFKNEPHDKYWGCFIRAARTRLQRVKSKLRGNRNATFTLMVYLDGYRTRSVQDKRDLIPLVYSVRDRYGLNLVPIRNGQDLVDYMNQGKARDIVKIAEFEYFGHSNQAAFMFDYSNEILSCSKSWLHQNELSRLRKNLFAPHAFVKSWGCYTGKSMSQSFRKATGTPMIGATGKTTYDNRDDTVNGIVPILSSPESRWTE